jgi:hypothetical protein
VRNALRNDQPKLREQTSDLIGLRGAGLHEALPYPV